MIKFVGKLPQAWEPKWEQLRLANKMEVTISEDATPSESMLERKFAEHVKEPELKHLLPIIKGLTAFLPSDRMSASQALNDIKHSS